MIDSPLYDYGMLSLTQREQLVLILILAALLLGAGIRHVRLLRLLPNQSIVISHTR